MRLPRRYARLSLLLTGLGVLCIPLGMLAGGGWPAIGLGAFLFFYIAASGVQMRSLRCPHCGRAVLPARWSDRRPVLGAGSRSPGTTSWSRALIPPAWA